ncbi:MAG: type II toxin-antitoxin system HicB family antitoxin [Chloroflexi bacterium]|nr:type II toxin-antitoxin system HicB family antitoxin [Chloroflexota bacterium]
MTKERVRKFTIVLEPEEDGGFSVHCPALPGCSSQGDSLEEAVTNIGEAIACVMEVRRNRGLPMPRENPEMIAAEIREILAGRAEDGLPLTIETREIEVPDRIAV